MHDLNVLYQVNAKTSAIQQLMEQLSSSRISHLCGAVWVPLKKSSII